MKYLLLIASVMILASCTGIKGKIKTQGDDAYIVNTDHDTPYQFTVKTTKVVGNNPPEYFTTLYTLAPGEEKKIGKLKVTEYDDAFDYSAAKKEGYSDSEIVVFVKEKFKEDTAIKFDENGMPYRPNNLTYSFEVKGQLTLSTDKYLNDSKKPKK